MPRNVDSVLRLDFFVLRMGFAGGSDPPAMQEIRVQSLGHDGLLEKGRECLPTPVFLSGQVHGQRSLTVNSPWGCKESDMTN